MGFSISFIDKPGGYLDEVICRGKIVIGDFEEIFDASLSYWSTEDYVMHWKWALKWLLDGADRSCLITSMYDPQKANFIFWWPLYRNGEIVYIRNHILLFEKLSKRFNEKALYQFVPDRQANKQVSEWSISLGAITAFYSGM